MAAGKDLQDPLGSSDDDAISLTSTVASEEPGSPRRYEMEEIRWEEDLDGSTYYLVKWEGYDELENTYEPAEHFDEEQTLLDWRDRKMRIARGLVEPFDISSWERRVEAKIAAAKNRRRLRRQKKIDLGLSVTDKEPSSGNSSDDGYREDPGEGQEDGQFCPPSPVWSAKEESSLLEGLGRFKTNDWRKHVRMYGSGGIINTVLKDRNEEGLQRKAIALEKAFRDCGKDFPIQIQQDKVGDRISAAKHDHTSVQSQRPQHKPGARGVASLKRKEDVVTPRLSKPQDLREATSKTARRPEIQTIRIPTKASGVSEPRNAPIRQKGLPLTSPTAKPTSPSPRLLRRPSLPQTKGDRRPTRLGGIGRGPAKVGLFVANTHKKPGINVMENWGDEPDKRRKSRYEKINRQEEQGKPLATFKRFSTRRKFELAGRYEHAPEVNSLTFLNLKNGKELPKPPVSVARKATKKTPFQLLQENIDERQADLSSVPDLSSKSILQRAATTGTSISISGPPPSAVESPSITEDLDMVDRIMEADPGPSPARRASLPFETATQRLLPQQQIFAAPVAVMGSGLEAAKGVITVEHRSVTTQPEVRPSQSREGAAKKPEVVRRQSQETRSDPRRGSEPALIQSPSSAYRKSPEEKQYAYPEARIPQRRDSLVRRPESASEQSPDIYSDRRRASAAALLPSPVPPNPASANPASGKKAQGEAESKPALRNPEVMERAALRPAPSIVSPAAADGYTLFPHDSLPKTPMDNFRKQSTDVIAEILTGPEGHSTGKVLFKGLAEFENKNLFITIRVPPLQMHVWCKTMCTAGEFVTIFHDPTSYLDSGWIGSQGDSFGLDNVSGILAEHASGGLFFAEQFTLLIYPAKCIGWQFLDGGFPSVPPNVRLRFAMLKPLPQIRQSIDQICHQPKPTIHAASLKDLPINTIIRDQFGMDYKRLVAQSSDNDGTKMRQTKSFFLIFPLSAREEFDIAATWIRANNGSANIYKCEDTGAWDHFYNTVDKGVIICHNSFIDYWVIPNLAYALRKSINMFNFSLEPMSPFAPDQHLIRLFPAGMAILLTDSLFLLRPLEAARILAWFRLFALPTKPPGTWKICTRPAIRDWLLKIQARLTFPYGKDFVSCYGEMMHLLPLEMTKEWDREIPKDEASIACMGAGVKNFDRRLGTNVSSLIELDNQAIIRNDMTLCSWFAGWAMMKQEKFRRFHIVTGREGEGEQWKILKDSVRKWNHVGVMGFEKFAKAHDVWDWGRLKRKDEERRAEAKRKDEERTAGEAKEPKSRRASVMSNNGDIEMREAGKVVEEEESLFLPMDTSPT